jgi:hypothetical protein
MPLISACEFTVIVSISIPNGDAVSRTVDRFNTTINKPYELAKVFIPDHADLR